VHRNEVGLESVLNQRCGARAVLGVELDKAFDDRDKALDSQPKSAAFLDSRAWVRLRRGDLRDALNDDDRALKIRPDGAWSP
jgi:tetratricopeptide (TPR) repeat protein